MKNAILTVTMTLAASGVSAAPVYVALSGDGSDGASWATAYTNIQTAINNPNATNGVWIKAATYAVTNPVVMASKVALYGGFAGTETSLAERNWRANATVITNTVEANAAVLMKRVIQCDSRSNWRLDGLHIAGGSLYSADFNSGNENQGAGVSANDCGGSNVIANCRITQSRGVSSGAYSAALGMRNLQANSTLVVEGTLFDDNTTGSICGIGRVLGSGAGSTVVFRNCVFRRNQSNYNSCINKAAGELAVLRIENCVFINNGRSGNTYSQALSVEGPGGGSTYVYNCSFVDQNNGTAAAVAEVTDDSNLVLLNNHFYGNSLIFKDFVSSSVSSNVNTAAALNALPEAEGNVDGDPRFLDKAKLDLRFLKVSPCVDAGTNLLGFAPGSDYYGNARPADLPGLGGEVSGSTYDIGVYELPPGVSFAVYVAQSGDGTAGTNWVTAFTNVQTALSHPYAAYEGVWIKAGIYAITNPIVLTNNAALYGGFAGTESSLTQRNWRANATVISNTVIADAANPVKRVVQGDTWSNWRLDGLHLVCGSLYSSGFSGADVNRGAGVSMNLSGGSNVIANCRIAGNKGTGGAGAYSAGLGMNLASDAKYVIENTVLDDNVSKSVNGQASLANGSTNTVVIFRNCVISRGKCGGGYGSGITKTVCPATLRVENCVFIDNGFSGDRTKALEVTGPGGGPTYVFNCSFVDHTNSTAPAVAELSDDSPLELYNNHFYNNSVMFKDWVSSSLSSNVNTVAALNALPEAEGNITGDPLFADRANFDLRFPKASPCVDAGTNVLGFAPGADYYGTPRPVDLPGVGADGAGKGYDIGIYEFPPPSWSRGSVLSLQ